MSACEELTCGHIVVEVLAPWGAAFQCPKCNKRSSNPDDIRHGWCGRCKEFVTDPHPTFGAPGGGP